MERHMSTARVNRCLCRYAVDGAMAVGMSIALRSLYGLAAANTATACGTHHRYLSARSSLPTKLITEFLSCPMIISIASWLLRRFTVIIVQYLTHSQLWKMQANWKYCSSVLYFPSLFSFSLAWYQIVNGRSTVKKLFACSNLVRNFICLLLDSTVNSIK